LVGAFEGGCLGVVPERATLVAGLVLDLASYDVENERIARDLLVRFYLDDVTGLDAAPVGDLEALVSLGEDKLLHGLAIHSLGRLF
jgi:hypothetical protein